MSIIDTISAGFGTVTKRVWLIALPVALDLVLWFGPKLSVAPLVEKMIVWMNASIASASSLPEGMAPSLFDLNVMTEVLRETVGRTNLLGSLAMGRFGFPSVASVQSIPDSAANILTIDSTLVALGAQMLILALGLWIASLYLCLLAHAVRDTRIDAPHLPLEVTITWLKLAIIFVPLSLGLAFTLSVSMLLGPLVIMVGIGVLWLMLLVSFVPQAVALAGDSPWRAVVSSLNIVRLNLWATLGLVLLTNVLSAGLGLIFARWLALNGFIGLIAIVANAYVGTGLTLALFIFYRDRLLRLQQLIQERRSHSA